ncbi:hypothetical protein [Streptomyces sp. NPDC057582]|uniref:hypothetical protein n=1 Tax=unclassified Streptomyces TaxID=2593676 RepID=UPI003678A5FF
MAEQLVEVVDRAEVLDLCVDVLAPAVVEVAAEPLEELGESWLDRSAALTVLGSIGRGGEAGGHGVPADGRAVGHASGEQCDGPFPDRERACTSAPSASTGNALRFFS